MRGGREVCQATSAVRCIYGAFTRHTGHSQKPPTPVVLQCPVAECQEKSYADWQAVMRHYIGNKHGVLEKFVKEMLSARENSNAQQPVRV